MHITHIYIRHLIAFVTLIFLSVPGFSQQKSEVDSVAWFVKHGLLFNKLNPQEKVYLHFDNTGYFKGETIWF